MKNKWTFCRKLLETDFGTANDVHSYDETPTTRTSKETEDQKHGQQ
ncbi:MAG: hypothetical protein HXS46_19750 [Theionarchaea archaeon]|nr:hypothetical protein [Theionarchaea archaeon]